MRRRFAGLSQAALPSSELRDGIYLVRVERIRYRWDKQKPYYAATFTIIEPPALAGSSIHSRLYCTTKSLWKLAWFLRDFGYSAELLSAEELDESAIVGLRGMIKISHAVVNGRTLLNIDGFAPSNQWSSPSPSDNTEPEVA